MEGRRSDTRVGVPTWTPYSPLSPNGSQLSWDKDRDEDFESQMDENGIIGLGDAVELMDEEEEMVLQEDLLLDTGTPEPEEGPPPALEDLSCHLSELLDSEPFSQPTGDDCPSPSHHEDGDGVAREDWSDDDELKLEESTEILNVYRPQLNSRPEKLRVESITDNGTENEKVCRESSDSLQRGMDLKWNCWGSHYNFSNERNTNMTTRSNVRLTNSQNSCNQEYALKERLNVFAPQSSATIPHALLSYKLSSEEQASDFTAAFHARTKSLAESHSSHTTKNDQPVRFEEEQHECKVTQQVGMSRKFTEDDLETKTLGSHHTNHQPLVPSPHQLNSASQASCRSSGLSQHIANVQSSSSDSSPLSTPQHRRNPGQRPSKLSHTELKDVRKGKLSHPLPDFSKVEPRVRFPKSGYKPPRSRRPLRKRDPKLEAPLVFKSPAEIVREVLLSSTEGLSDTTAPGDPQNLVNCKVPEEFRCPLQASTLVQQLQDDYNRLLTKYAEAENTIDRLRVEAKVSLCSDLPKPSQSALPSVHQEASKVMTLSFPQAQRAELSANTVIPTQDRINSEFTRVTHTHSSSLDSSSTSLPVSTLNLTEALFKQTQEFQLQVDEFEELLKNGKCKHYEQKEVLFQLVQGQDSLERSYLAARDQYQQVQKQTGCKSGYFDPNRELEGLIFNSGMRLEELRDRMEQSEQNQPTLEPSPIRLTHAHQPFVNKTEPQPENPVSAAEAEIKDGLEVSSVSEVGDGDRAEDEEEIFPASLRPLHQKHQHVEKDFNKLMDHYQNFRELPKLLDRGLCEVACDSVEVRSSLPLFARNDRIKDGRLKTKHETDSRKSVHSFPAANSLSCSSGSSHAEVPFANMSSPRYQDSEKKPSVRRKSQSSLGESSSKECDRVLRAPLQDGVITPETDSGFVGSESSRLTPAAHSPVQQRAAVRVTRPSVTQEKGIIKPESVSVIGQPSLGSPAHTQGSTGQSGGGPSYTERKKETERLSLLSPSTSISPLRWHNGPVPPWTGSGISEPEQQSDSAQSLSGEERRQTDQYRQLANQNGCCRKSHSPAVPYHHGDHLKAQSSVQLTNQHDALQSLQDEVEKLRECLEGSLRTNSPGPVRAPLFVMEDFRSHKPFHTSTLLQPNFKSFEQSAAHLGRPLESIRSGEEERGRAAKRVPRRSASLPRFKPELDITTDSEQSDYEPRPQTSRHIPTSSASRRARLDTRRSTGPSTSIQQRSTSADPSEVSEDDAEGRRGSPPLCTCCLARVGSRTPKRAAKNVGSPSRHYSRHCLLCGARVPSSANQTFAPRETPVPVKSFHRERGGVYLAAAPPPSVLGSVQVLQCVPICPSVFYFSSAVSPSTYPKSPYLSRNEDRGHRPRFGGHHRRSHSMDAQHSVKSSLDRAVAAASSMQEVSRRMAHSLASGLQHTSKPLEQSWTY